MNFKTITIIVITVLITIFLTLNNQTVAFDLIFTTQEVSKLVVIGVCFLLGFLVGIMVARPKKKMNNSLAQNTTIPTTSTSEKSLSDEDRNYIN